MVYPSLFFSVGIFIYVILVIFFIPILIIDLIVYRKLNDSYDTNYFYYAGFFLAIFLYILGFILTYIVHSYFFIIVISIIIGPFVIYIFKIIFNKIIARSEKKDIKKQKKILQRQELLAKCPIVEDLIQEKNFSNAIIELNNILNEAKVHKFREIYNWANEKLTLCENFEKDLETFEKSIPMIKKIIQEKTISEATYDLEEIIGETKAKAIKMILTTFKDVVQEIYNNNLSEIEKSSYVNLNIKDLAENQELHQIFEKLLFPYSFRIKFLQEILPMTFLIKEGLPVIIQDNLIVMRPIYGLKLFLTSLFADADELMLSLDIPKIFKNLEDYLNYSRKILKFIRDNGRVPEKNEVWDLEIPIVEMDLVLDLINIKITGNVYSRMTLAEKKYYDQVSKPIINSKEKLDKFNLEYISTEFGLNLIDAKIIPIFISYLLTLEDISKEISNYLKLSELSVDYFNKLNILATNIIKAKLSENKKVSLLDLARKLNTSLIEIGEALYFLNNSDKLIKEEFTIEEIERLSKNLTEALKYCHNQNEELNVNLLISRFNIDLKTANEIVVLYGMEFTLPEQLIGQEIKNLDQNSRSVIRYIKEINEKPTIDDLMISLNLDIRSASIILSFINKISSKPFQEDFEKYPEEILLKIDDLSCKILKLKKVSQKELNLINLAYQLDTGIYSIKRALFYFSWIENKLDLNYIIQLSTEEKSIVKGKIKEALKYIKEKDLKLEFAVLIKEVGFNLRDTYLIIGLYNNIISQEIDVESFSDDKKRKIDALAHEIYNAQKKSKIISKFEPEEVFTLDIDGANLETLYEALVYLKVKVFPSLMGESKIIETETAKISPARIIEEFTELEGTHGTRIGKREGIELAQETIELEETQVRVKSTAEKVELRRGTGFEGGFNLYKTVIKNNTDMVINNVEISLKMTAEHIRIVDIKPRVYKKGSRAEIRTVSPGQSLSIEFILEPMICGSIPISPMVSYIDAFGATQMITRDSILVDSKCPLIINPGEENIAKVKSIYESNYIIRSFRTFELEHDPNQSFGLLMEAIGSAYGKCVSKPYIENDDPYIAEVYYYVLSQNPDPNLGHQEQIIVKIRVDDEKNVAMLSIGAEQNKTVNGTLTRIWELANIRFGEMYGYIFKSLLCPECAAPLENMEKDQKIVKCKHCGLEFEKRSLK